MNFPHVINGFKIVTNIRMTKAGEPYQIKRNMWQRLFSLPWHPLICTKTIIPQIPSDQCIRNGDKLIMHPETAKKIIYIIGKQNESQTQARIM